MPYSLFIQINALCVSKSAPMVGLETFRSVSNGRFVIFALITERALIGMNTVCLNAYFKHVVPDGSAAKVDMEVCVAVLNAHQAILLHVRLLVLLLVERNVLRPAGVHPAQLTHNARRLN